ncbi:hypothetical protein LR48_Vigan311s000300 [Vigna angularis]|uniref:Uncharacterized protein n=1 Tax=Phaseolus angularis TaxID=3914 RepID=A0A0L9T9F2_PHAAN|nr:hypothetical protein LR48_Vigan311s000300 [Vigna angularis]
MGISITLLLILQIGEDFLESRFRPFIHGGQQWMRRGVSIRGGRLLAGYTASVLQTTEAAYLVNQWRKVEQRDLTGMTGLCALVSLCNRGNSPLTRKVSDSTCYLVLSVGLYASVLSDNRGRISIPKRCEFGERSEEGERWNQKRHQKVQKEKPQLPLSGSLPLSGTQEFTGDPLRGKMAAEGKKPTHALTAERQFTAERHYFWAWA